MAIKSPSSSLPPGFTRDFSRRECPCIGVFGPQGSGKTRLAATAGEWAAMHDKTPGWIVCDRKTRKTARETCEALGLDLPLINEQDFVTQQEALKLAVNTDVEEVKKIYTGAIKKLIDAVVTLGSTPYVDPIVIDSGTQLWDWIAFSHFGRKQDVGKSRVWGPPKQDWTDLLDAVQHKNVLITFHSRDEYRNDNKTGNSTWDGPPHLGYTTTSVVRVTESNRKLQPHESYVDRFSLDVVESQDNKAQAGMDGVLAGEEITFMNLLMLLRPEMED